MISSLLTVVEAGVVGLAAAQVVQPRGRGRGRIFQGQYYEQPDEEGRGGRNNGHDQFDQYEIKGVVDMHERGGLNRKRL